MTNLGKEISFTTNTSSNKTYLVTDVNDLKIIDFQIEMVNKNVDGAFLTIEKKELNSKIQLCFETTSLISMDIYFEKNTISRKNFLDILRNLCIVLVKAEEQYLSSNNYILDLNKIYIDGESLKVKYIYIPIEENYNKDVDSKFKEMIKNIVEDCANIDDAYSKYYLDEILDFLKKEKTTIKEFYEFFLNNIYSKELDNGDKEQEKIEDTLEENKSFNNQSDEVQPNTNDKKTINNNPEKINNNHLQVMNSEVQVSNDLYIKKNQLNEETEFEEKYKPENIIVCAVTGTVTVVLTILTFVMLSNSYIIEKFVVAIILALVDFLVFIVFLDKEDKVKVGIKKNIHTSINNENLNDSNISNENLNDNSNNSIQNNDSNSKMESSELDTSINIPMNNELAETDKSQIGEESEENSNDNTMIISVGQPYLVPNNLKETKKIYINKEKFKIGRAPQQVDYAIPNKVVGKIHAEVVSKSGMCYITDLNSKNGTFINGKRIDSDVEYVLNDEDEIMIANIKYIFKLD